MYIRSQDKKSLINTENNSLIVIDCYEKYSIYASDCGYIGYYSTEERALEVLDEICRMIEPRFIIENGGCSRDVLERLTEDIKYCGTSFSFNNGERIETIHSNNFVYQMPKE